LSGSADPSRFVEIYHRALREVSESYEELLKQWKARQQTVGERLEESPFAEVGTITQGYDYTGEKIPHTVESLEGGMGVDRITSMNRDHIRWMKKNGIKTDLDELGDMLMPQQHAADAPLWAFMEARAISERSIVPPVWHEQLLDLEQHTEKEPSKMDLQDRKEREESLKKKFLTFKKKQED